MLPRASHTWTRKYALTVKDTDEVLTVKDTDEVRIHYSKVIFLIIFLMHVFCLYSLKYEAQQENGFRRLRR